MHFRRASTAATVLALLVAPSATASVSRAPQPARDARVPTEVIVRFAPGVRAEERRAVRARAGVRAKQALGLPRTQLLAVEPGTTAGDAVARLERSDLVSFAERNRRMRIQGSVPNDPYFQRLWGLQSNEPTADYFGGVVDADIDAPEAWDLARGSSDVVVAVVDTGVQYQHPDLVANLWTNGGEVPANGVDDDGNGFVDDRQGWDFADGDGDPMDLNGHGTHVAGTIGAVGDNGTGVTGVAWQAKLMPLRALGADGSGSVADVGHAFEYAARNGARVVNASLGSRDELSRFHEAVIAAHPDVLFVFAAGNDGEDVDAVGSAPCASAQPNVVCVAATNPADGLAGFSNFGARTVDVGAPGVAVLSTWHDKVVFRDRFEGGTFAAHWTNDGWQLGSDELGGFAFAKGKDATLTTAAGVASAQSGCELRFWRRVPATGTDAAVVETSADGTGWQVARLLPPGGDWQSERLVIGAGHRIRFRLDDAGLGNGSFQLDDVEVRCDGVDARSSYAFLSGTSMATPHVAGAAAVLMAMDPDATAQRLRSLLLSTGDPLNPLSGRTTSGRRLNLAAAVEAARLPVPTTGPATGVTATTARLTGAVNPNGVGADYFFEWGPTRAYGSVTPTVHAGSGTAPVPAAAELSGLAAGMTYHFRIVAVRGSTRVAGPDSAFTTEAAPPDPAVPAEAETPTPTPTPTPDPTPTPTPEPTPTPTSEPQPDPLSVDRAALIASTARAACRRRGRILRCRFTAADAVRVRGVIRTRRGRTVGRYRGRAGTRIRVRGRRLRPGRYAFAMNFTDLGGNRAPVRKRVRIR